MVAILQTLAQYRAGAPEQVLSAAGGDWRIRISGDSEATTLLLLPGAMGTADIFCRTVLALGRGVRCITATPPAWTDSARLVDSLAALLDGLGLAQAHLLGSSISGYLLQVFALRHPERVATLFLSSAFADPTLIQARLPDAGTLAEMPAEQVMRELPVRLVPEPLRRSPDPALAALMSQLVGVEQDAARLKTRLQLLALATPVPAVDLPPRQIVLIDDASDPIVPDAARQQLRQRYARSDQHALDGGGHYPMVLQAEAYATVLRGRLAHG